jgi:hypothetical protein
VPQALPVNDSFGRLPGDPVLFIDDIHILIGHQWLSIQPNAMQ